MLLFMLQYREEEVLCNADELLPIIAYATGDEASKLSALAVYSLNDKNGYLNKLQAGNTGKYTFIHLGTSDGKLMKVVHHKIFCCLLAMLFMAYTASKVNLYESLG